METAGMDPREPRGPGQDETPALENGERETQPTDMSEGSDSEDKNNAEAGKCTCPHTGRLLLHQQFPYSVDQLFTMMFTSCKFSIELMVARNGSQFLQPPWQQLDGVKTREVRYVLGLPGSPIGPKEVQVVDKQQMNKCSKPGVLYSIDCSCQNSGFPYADYFTVETHYCLQRVSENVSELFVFASMNYKKNLWAMVKTFVEKNTFSGLEEYARLLETRLLAEADSNAPPARKGRRHRRHTTSSQETATEAAVSPSSTLLAPRPSVQRARTAGGSSSWHGTLLVTVLVLLLLNALLFHWLYHPPNLSMDDLYDRMSSMSEEVLGGQWSSLLERHTRRQRGELMAWRRALDATVTHLQQTEQALRKVLKSIEPSLLEAQEESRNTHAPVEL